MSGKKHPTGFVNTITGQLQHNNPAEQGNYVPTPAEAMSAPLPSAYARTAFARTVCTRVARRMMQMLMDLRVPVSVEYVCGDVLLCVPFTYAGVLDKIREDAERDLQAGLFAPVQPSKP